MEIRNIRTFLRVAELQSFTKAADQLGYSQAAVTVQIKQLEEELGTQLFDRIGKHIKLTEHGIRFMDHAMKVLKAAEDASTFVHKDENPSGKLRIGSIASLSMGVLPPVLLEFRTLCPQVETSIETSRFVTELLDMMRQNDVDLLYFLDRKLYSSEWIKVFERPETIVFVTYPSHPLAGKKNVPMERLLEEPLILTTRGVSYCDDLEQLLAAKGLELHPFLEIGDTDVIIKLLQQQAGISFLPQYLVQEYLDTGILTVITTDIPIIQMWSQLIYHKNKWITPQMRIFIDLVKKHAGVAY
ncbi:LysR family transcriptional regulator [Emergencia sp.]|uniref:LysR family transcriptional regulator n=1 Tax=Emergencia sp. TaxID=1926557 RepID=UPI003AF038F7